MSKIVSDMREIYRIRKYDFMGYTFRNINDLSFHHIHKACDGGPKTIENGALLNKNTSHPYLHMIEYREIQMYNDINKILKEINNQYSHPTKEQLIRIREILLEFESLYGDELNVDGKKLIKSKFIEDRININRGQWRKEK